MAEGSSGMAEGRGERRLVLLRSRVALLVERVVLTHEARLEMLR